MALPRTLTVADLYAMPESVRGERYELIDGDLFVTPSPVSRHQAISSNLFFHVAVHVRTLRLGWVRDNSGVHVDDRTYVIPDLVFISHDRRHIFGEANIEAAPDLVVEILSPSTRRQDLITKRALYARIGVREYWLVDPGTRSVTVLVLEGDRFAELLPDESGVVPSPALPGLRLTLDELFEDMDLSSGAPLSEE